MKKSWLQLDPASGETGGGGAATPITPVTPAAPAPVAKAPVTNPSHAPKAPRELTETEKKSVFKIDDNDPLFKPDTSVKSSDLKPDIKDVSPGAKTTPEGGPAVKAPASEAPTTPKAATTTTPELAAKGAPAKATHEPIVPKGTAAEKKEFDYTGFTEQESYALKNMSIPAREWAMKLHKENKELERMKTAQFMQHPAAYTLDPTYSKLQEDVFYYNKETEYWQEQLARVKNGDTWQPIKGWTKNGEPVAGDPQPANASSEEQIRLMMNRCYTATEAKQQEVKQFSATYKQRLDSDSKAINDERARRFGWVADPKILDAKVEVEPGVIKSVNDIREDLISLFPPYLQHTQGVQVAADLFAALQIYGEENRSLKAGKQVAEVKAEEVTRAEPTSRNSLTGGGGNKNGLPVKEFTLQGLPL